MDGLGWLIKNALQASGVEIDPEEIKKTIDTAKVLIPNIAQMFEAQRVAVARIERKLDALMEAQGSKSLIEQERNIDSELRLRV